MVRFRSLSLVSALGLAACSSEVPVVTHPVTPPSASVSAPPLSAERLPLAVATRRDDVSEVLHGQTVLDPYRWLEDGEAPAVAEWTAKQNALTAKELGGFPGRSALAKRLASLLQIGSVGAPSVVPAKRSYAKQELVFFRKQSPTQDQSVLFVRVGAAPDVALVDPNAKTADGTVSLDYWFPSNTGRYLAYGLSAGGDEKATLRVLDTKTGRDLGEADTIPDARYASVAWLPDDKGFYYTRLPAKGTVPDGEENYHRKVFFHRLGTPPASDALVFGEGRKLTDSPWVDLSPNGRWLVVTVSQGWSRSEVYLQDRTAKKPSWVPVAVPEGDVVYHPNAYDDAILVRTNDGAPTYQLFSVDPTKPERASWKLLVPGRADRVLQNASRVGKTLHVTCEQDAHTVLERYDLGGKRVGEVALPGLGTSGGVHGPHDGAEGYFAFASFTTPGDVYRVSDAGAATLWDRVKPPVDASEFTVEQRKATSKDGTQIPYFVVRKNTVAEDGSAPGLLHGYGGFDISQTPGWIATRYPFLEAGGVYVLANLRGGSEYGEAWHQAGMLGKKQNVFDDYYAVAEHLVATKVVSPERLAASGGSNGGLLVGVAVTQRPELFRAAVSMVPLMDMVRYPRFRIAKLWIPEYGDPDKPDAFAWLKAYSPYHNLKEGVSYPATLLATAEGDSRVDPLHARKMAAALQYANAQAGSPRRVLLRVEAKAGHGAGKPVSKRIEEATDVLSFLFQELGVQGGGT